MLSILASGIILSLLMLAFGYTMIVPGFLALILGFLVIIILVTTSHLLYLGSKVFILTVSAYINNKTIFDRLKKGYFTPEKVFVGEPIFKTARQTLITDNGFLYKITDLSLNSYYITDDLKETLLSKYSDKHFN